MMMDSTGVPLHFPPSPVPIVHTNHVILCLPENGLGRGNMSSLIVSDLHTVFVGVDDL
jgi:hypothetical protein